MAEGCVDQDTEYVYVPIGNDSEGPAAKHVVISRDRDGKLHEERLEAASFNEALRRHRHR